MAKWKDLWNRFVFVWAVNTSDPNIGRRKLELHFSSQLKQEGVPKLAPITKYIFKKLLEHDDLSFLANMSPPESDGDFINGTRVEPTERSEKIMFRMDIKDLDYGFLRVDHSGTFPDGWWDLAPEKVWGIIKKGLNIKVHRGKKGNVKKGVKTKLSEIRQKRMEEF